MKRIRVLLLLCLCIWVMKVGNLCAESSFKIKMNGSVIQYSGTKVNVSFNGEVLDTLHNPGIVVNGIALLPYDEVFKKGMGVSCNYNVLTKSIVFKKDGNTVKVTEGSTIAYVNGVRQTISVVPRKVYYYNTRMTKLMIPSRFIAEALEYTYNWNASTATAQICTPYSLFYGNKWHVYKGTKGGVEINGCSINVKDMPTIVLNNSAFIQAQKVFSRKELNANYHYDKSTRTVFVENETASIKYILNSKTAYVNGTKCLLKIAPMEIKDNVTNKYFIMVPAKFTAETLGYGYTWNSVSKKSEITVVRQREWTWKSQKVNVNSACTNTLESIVLQMEKEEESIILTGKSALHVDQDFSERSNQLSISISNLNNVSTKCSKKLYDSPNIEKIEVSECETGNVTIILTLTENVSFFEEKTGRQYKIYFEDEDDENVIGDSIELKKPKGVSFADIKDEDQYYQKQFKITIPGNFQSYYKNLSAQYLEGVNQIQCSLNSNGETVLTFKTDRILGYKLNDNGDTFEILVGEPKDIYESIVLLDPGHGGVDPGCISNGVQEKNCNFNILYKYAKQYFNSRKSPIKAYWTRTTDKKIELGSRAAYSKTVQADVFISLHMNCAGSSAAKGAETYYTVTNNKENSFGLTSRKLALHMQSKWPSQLGLSTSRGVRTANYVVTKKNTVPAVLVELGFLSNSSDLAIVSSSSTQKKAAKTFYNTVCELFEEYPTGR